MSDTPNQKPITSFFRAPKRSRPPESDVEIADNRPSKLPIPNRNSDDSDLLDSETNFQEDFNYSDNEIQLLSIEDNAGDTLSISNEDNDILFINEGSSLHPIHPTSDTSTEKSKGRIYLWKNEYHELFKWLEYDPIKGKAWCSYSSCKMYIILYQEINNRSWERTQMARHWFEQHEKTKKHCNHGRKPEQTAVTKYMADKPTIQHSDTSIAIRIQTAWWLAKEDVAIMKFGSLLKAKLITHKYNFLIMNYSSF